MSDGPDLEHHHADCVGDDVVELARDADALLRDRGPGSRLPLPFGLGRAQLCRLGLLGTLAESEASEPADPENERDEDLLGRRVRGQVEDDDRRAAHGDDRAQPRLQRVAHAVAHGIKSTAGVVTSAAVVMVAVFSVFGALSLLGFKQFGVGLAAAVLIDATIVRAVLLPATMKLLGDWNWYLPGWLQWLPRFDLPEAEAPPAKTTPVSA